MATIKDVQTWSLKKYMWLCPLFTSIVSELAVILKIFKFSLQYLSVNFPEIFLANVDKNKAEYDSNI